MANPTTNFGWVMPTSTDLVTDLPADFAIFGQAVDTSMADLKGGTTGQILAKATNTDMDFTWITNDVGDITAVNVTAPITGGGTSGAVTIGVDAGTTSAAGVVQLTDSTSSTSTTTAATPNSVKSAYDLANAAIAKSIVDAKGDILTATADNTPARLAIGTNGQTLVADSSTATGLKWAAASSGALTLVKRATFTNVANTGTTFDNVFTSTYPSYLVVIEQIYAVTSTDDLWLNLRYGGTTQAGTSYAGAITMASDSGVTGNTFTAAQAKMTLSNQCGGVTDYVSMRLNFNGVGNTSEWAGFHGTGIQTGGTTTMLIGGAVLTARTYDGFILQSQSSNITGTISIYGLAK